MTTQPAPFRPVDSDPSMNEALRRARRSRIEQAIAHSLAAAALADEAGDPDYAAGYRADADRMRRAMA
jgi:hypothetical protein